MKENHKEWSFVLGRFQCKKPHAGHTGIIYQLLKEGKNVCIGLREEDGGEKNPYTQEERKEAFQEIFGKEIHEGRVCILYVPDIIEIVYGRTPGWDIKEVRLSKEVENISGTKMREQGK